MNKLQAEIYLLRWLHREDLRAIFIETYLPQIKQALSHALHDTMLRFDRAINGESVLIRLVSAGIDLLNTIKSLIFETNHR